MQEQSTNPNEFVLALGKPGEAHCGRGVNEALAVMNALGEHGILSCVVGAKALVYYGAHRVPMVSSMPFLFLRSTHQRSKSTQPLNPLTLAQNWEICVPTDSFDEAKQLLTSSPLSDKYELWHPVMPQPGSLVHTYPRFMLQGVNFFFILIPASEYLIQCSPGQCERSPSGILYPKLEYFAQSLLDTQRYADLADLIDGMNLDEAWGETHLQLNKPVPIEYIREKNELIARHCPESMRNGLPFALLSESPRPRDVWLRQAQTKDRRINEELGRHRYLTRFRKVGSSDPRENKEREV